MTLPPLPTLLRLAAFLAAGGLGGSAYFYMVWRSARSLRNGGRLPVLLALMFLRFAVLASLLTLAALQGAKPLLATALGVFFARALVMRKFRDAT